MNQLYGPIVGSKYNQYSALGLAIEAGATSALPALQSMGDKPEASWPAIVDLIFDIVRHRDRLALKRKALGRHKRRLARKHRQRAAR
jgi:hypothetical protein